METTTLLLNLFPTEILIRVLEHFEVPLITAILVIIVGYFRDRLINLSAWFVPIKVHGTWYTTMTKSPPEIPLGAVVSPPQSQKVWEDVVLHQFFNKVWGKTYVHNDNRDIYAVRGRLVAKNLVLIFHDTNGFNTGSIFLRVTSKELMQGFEVGEGSDGNLYSGVYIWHKVVNKFAARSSGH